MTGVQTCALPICRVWVRVRVSVRVRARFRVRVRIRVRVRVRVGVRVRVRFRERVVIKPIPLSRYPLARKGILFGGVCGCSALLDAEAL